MGYGIIIALLLGIISLIITLKYIDQYDKLHKGLKSLSNKINGSQFPEELIDIQSKLNITDVQFKNLLKEKQEEIIAILKTEQFSNYSPVTNYSPDYSIKDTGIIKKQPNKHDNNTNNNKNIPIGSLLSQNTITINKFHSPFDINIIPNYNEKSSCKIDTPYGEFCFNLLEKDYCPGNIEYGHCK